MLYISMLLLMACLTVQPVGLHAELTSEGAQRLLDDYVRTVRKGNEPDIRSFWSTRFTSEDFFRDVPICLDESASWAEYIRFLQKNDARYQVQTVTGEKDYFVVKSELRLGIDEAEAGKEMPFYILKENGNWKLADPRQILTSDWKVHETKHFKFIYPASIDLARYAAEISFMELNCKKLLMIFQVKLTRKIRYYFTPSDQLTGQLLSSSPAQGYCTRSKHPERDPWFNFITSTSLADSHELVHALTALKGIPDINAFFLEGLAVALGGTTWTSRDYSIIETADFLRTGKFVDIRDFFTDEGFFEQTRIAYYESGAFVHFLLRKHGLNRYFEFCQAFSKEPDIPANCLRFFGQSLDQIIGEWKSDLLAQSDKLAIGYHIPDTLEPFFAMNDRTGDDYGAGSYLYPTHEAFKKGICDIVRLEMFADDQRVYFRVTMKEMIKPVFNPASSASGLSLIHI